MLVVRANVEACVAGLDVVVMTHDYINYEPNRTKRGKPHFLFFVSFNIRRGKALKLISHIRFHNAHFANPASPNVAYIYSITLVAKVGDKLTMNNRFCACFVINHRW